MSDSTKKNLVFRHTVLWGVVLGITSAVFYMVVYFTDQMANSLVGWLLYPILAVICILCVNKYRTKYSGGYVSLGKAFIISYLPFFYGLIVNGCYQLIFMSFILKPEYINSTIDKTATKLRTQGLAEHQIQKSVQISRYIFEHPLAAVGITALMFAFAGAIISVIVAAICRKDDTREVTAA